MRCDPNPLGCKPCQDRNVPCRTTDRITGRASERGHTERLETQLEMLRRQLGQYVSRFGHIEGTEALLNGGFSGYGSDEFTRYGKSYSVLPASTGYLLMPLPSDTTLSPTPRAPPSSTLKHPFKT